MKVLKVEVNLREMNIPDAPMGTTFEMYNSAEMRAVLKTGIYTPLDTVEKVTYTTFKVKQPSSKSPIIYGVKLGDEGVFHDLIEITKQSMDIVTHEKAFNMRLKERAKLKKQFMELLNTFYPEEYTL